MEETATHALATGSLETKEAVAAPGGTPTPPPSDTATPELEQGSTGTKPLIEKTVREETQLSDPKGMDVITSGSGKRGGGGKGDRINAVGVTIKILLDDGPRLKDA